MGLIFFLSSIPGLKSPWDAWDFFLRKGAPVFEYAVLSLLMARAGRETGPFREYPGAAAAAAALAYAASDELHQSFVVGRVGSPVDVMIDGAGCALGAWVHKRASEVR